jgi:hypothetical protein
MIEQLESELRSALSARADDLPAGAGARVRARDYRPRTRDLRPPVAAGVLTTAAAAAAAVLLIDLGPKTPAAFAGWTPTPTHASRAQVAGAQGDCTAQLAQLRSRAAQAAAQHAGQPPLLPRFAKLSRTVPVLTDTRGPFTFVVFNSGGANASCISGPGFASVTMQSAARAPAPPPAGKMVLSFQVHTARAGDAYTFVEGRASAGVTAATLVLSDGSHIQATVQNGWLVAWWPGGAQLTSAQLSTGTGTTTQTFDARLPADCPAPPPAGTPTPSGSTTPSGSLTPSGHITSRGAICSAVSAAGGSGQAAGAISVGSATGTAQAPVGGTATGGTGG